MINGNGRRCDGDYDNEDVKEGEQAVCGDESVKVVNGIQKRSPLSIFGDLRPGGRWCFKPPEGSGNINENCMAGSLVCNSMSS